MNFSLRENLERLICARLIDRYTEGNILYALILVNILLNARCITVECMETGKHTNAIR